MDETTIRECLDRVLAHPKFAGTSRISKFLRFVVEKKLAGDVADLKEYTIAIEVYGRGSDYDPRVDSIVRVEAGRLRSRLNDYYETDGAHDRVRFEIPRGSYIPEFVPQTPPAVVEEPAPAPARDVSSTAADVAPATAAQDRKRWVAAAILAVLLMGAAGYAFFRARGGPHPRALELYLQAKNELRPGSAPGWTGPAIPPNVLAAIDLYEQAVKVDDRFAAAWAGLGATYAYALYFDRTAAADLQRKAEAAARRAIEADPRSAEAHATLADMAQYRLWDFDLAEAEARRAVEFGGGDPSYARDLAEILRMRGKTAEAMALLDRADALRPSPIVKFQRGLLLLDTGNTAEAEQRAREALKIRADYRPALWLLGRCLQDKGQGKEAEAAYRQYLGMAPADVRGLSSLGHLSASAGNTAEARSLLQQLTELGEKGRMTLTHAAIVHAALGEKEQALQAIQQAFEVREPMLPYLHLEKRLSPLTQDARFQEIVRKVGARQRS